MNFSEIRSILEQSGVQPSKSLGQNFLCDENIARWIVDQLDISTHDCIVEAGPGTGALTKHLEGKCRKLILIEYDSRLAAYHQEKYAGREDIEVHHADGATWDIRVLYKEQPVKFIGNLPYSAGGAILSNFLDRPTPVEKAVVMLQKEFIDRIVARPEDDSYGLLSLRIQRNWLPHVLKTIPSEAFQPRPRIDSSILLLEKRAIDQFPPYNYRLMDELMRKSFAQRRKQMKRQMPPAPSWETISTALGIPATARGEELSLEQWINLTRLYMPPSQRQKPQSDSEILDVVDEFNEICGHDRRKNIHDLESRHRAVHLFVFTKKGDLIIQKRSPWKDRFPGVWDSSASGHVDSGETYLQAALRELDEELGIKEAELEKIGEFPATPMNGMEFVQLWMCKVSCRISQLEFPPAEIESLEAFPPNEIQKWLERRPGDFAPGFAECFYLWLHKKV